MIIKKGWCLVFVLFLYAEVAFGRGNYKNLSGRYSSSDIPNIVNTGNGLGNIFEIDCTYLKKINEVVLEGKVIDEEGDPLVGVTVLIKGKNRGTTTDKKGHFVLENLDDNTVLIVSYVGYQTEEIMVGGSTNIIITMKVASHTLNKMIVVGYGKQSKRNITSSISSISYEDIENKPSLQVGQALQGKVPGAQIIQKSGAPGSSMMVRIRGAGTVNNSSPIYVVDGIVGVDPVDINPDDIKSVDILKSASAAAIYGARGANGVVLITTKSGRMNSSNLNIKYSTGFQQVPNKLPLTNATEYAQLYNKALTNGNETPLFNEIDTLGSGTDWQNEIFRTVPINKLDLSYSGGGEKGTYYISGSYFNQKGIVLNSDYKRYSLRVNSEYKIKPFLSIGENISFSYGINNKLPDEFSSRGPIANAWHEDPTVPVKNPDGSWGFPKFSDTKNPVAELHHKNYKIYRPNFQGSVYIKADILKNLIFKSQLNANLGLTNSKDFTPVFDIFPLQRNLVSDITREDAQWLDIGFQNTITFNKSFGANNLEVLGGITTFSHRDEYISAFGQNLPENANTKENLRYLNLAKGGNKVNGSAGEYGLLSFLGRVNYSYENKYLFTGNVRIDGSSRFGRNNRFGTFPSVSIGWRISNEEFLKDVGFINDLKIRAGWGMLGNQSSLPNYAFANTITPDLVYVTGDDVAQGQAPTGAGNKDLKWETTKEKEIGIDFTGFDNRVSLSFDYYDKKTEGILLRIPIPSFTGVENPSFKNGGDVKNKGFELMIGYHKNYTDKNKLSYDVVLNLSKNINEVARLSNNQASILSGTYSRTIVGAPIGAFYGYVMEGLFQTERDVDNAAFQASGTSPGDIRFKDLNKDNKIDQNDRKIIGNPWPKLVYGLSGRLNWNHFDLNIALNGVVGNDIISAWKYFTEGSNFYNYDKRMLKSWSGPNTSNAIPRLNVNDPNDNTRASTFFIDKGTYLRLNNIQLGYTLPKDMIKGVEKLRIYISSQNLLTITEYKGYDPEIGGSSSISPGIDYGYYPKSRTFIIGLNLSL